jgi:threonine dehydrogenase-like Zn-dependent dehydrogenase
MRALRFHYSLPRFALSSVAGWLTPSAYLWPTAALTLDELPEPVLPAPDWVRVRTSLCGICGSDSKQVFLVGAFDNPITAYLSFPHVLGHEAVGVVESVGDAVTSLRVGQRVALNPWLTCAPRGVQPLCPACQRGDLPLCQSFAAGRLPPGLHLGTCSGASGAFAPLFAAHESQLFAIPDAVSDEDAVLCDPFSVSLHGILKAPPRPGDLALVYGCGTLGLLAVAALHRLWPETTVAVIAKYPYQAALAGALGAGHAIVGRGPRGIIEAVAGLTGTAVREPRGGLPMLLDGVDVIYDTIGSAGSLTTGVRVAKPKASIVVTGVATPARFEWTPLYFKEVNVVGANAFGIEELGGVRQHAFAHYLALAATSRMSLSGTVTHRFALRDYRRAFLVAHEKSRHGAVKVVFDLRA